MTGLYIAIGVIVFLFLVIILPGIFSVGANEVGILTIYNDLIYCVYLRN